MAIGPGETATQQRNLHDSELADGIVERGDEGIVYIAAVFLIRSAYEVEITNEDPRAGDVFG